jgi:hypothetical protein
MKTIVRYYAILIIIILISSCRTYDSEGFWSERSRSTYSLEPSSDCSQYLLLMNTEHFMVYSCSESLNAVKTIKQIPRYSLLKEVLDKFPEKDTVVCLNPPNFEVISSEIVYLLIKNELCWIYDKRTEKFIKKVVIEDVEWGNKNAALVGGAYVDIYVGEEILLSIITAMA